MYQEGKAMKFLYYRGVTYQHIQAAIDLVRVERPPSVPDSVKVLCYRGVYYLREVRTIPTSEPVPSQLALVQSRSRQLEQRKGKREMPNEQIGYLYKLYFLGWRNGSLKQFSQLDHWLLSFFFYYRRGFAEASEWKQDQLR